MTLTIYPLMWMSSRHGWQHAGNYRLQFNGYQWCLNYIDAAIGNVTVHATEALAKTAANIDHQTRITKMISINQSN